MEEMQKKKIVQNITFFVLSIVIILVVYFIISIVRLFQKPVDTVMIKNGKLIHYEEVVGYVIRNEEIVDTSSYDGAIKSSVQDATRVAKGSTIATYVSKSEQQIIDKIARLDEKIEKAIESKQTIFSNDVKALETEIESNIYSNIKGNENLYLLKEYKKNLNEKIEKKAKIVGELSPAGSELKTLMNERTTYEKELNDSEKILSASKAGLVSYRVDNLENVLTYDSISKLTIKDLKNIKVAMNQTIPMNGSQIKIIDNFGCCIAVPMKSQNAKDAKLNDVVYLRFKNTGDTLIPATIDYISNEEEEVLLVFRIQTNIEELTKYRKIGLDVVWWSYTGLKVSKDTLFDTEMNVEISKYIVNDSGEEKVYFNMQEIPSGENYEIINEQKIIKLPTITIKKSYSQNDVFVKILRETEDFVIVDNYKDQELREMGISEDIITNRQTVKMYDECIVKNIT